jgi:hypothetical protein
MREVPTYLSIIPYIISARHPPIKLERKVALCAANKIGRPLPGEVLLRDKLPTFHFRLSLLLYLRSTAQPPSLSFYLFEILQIYFGKF